MTLDEKMTILMGPNGSGKTTVLDAIDLFINKNSVEKKDFNDIEKPIEITMSITDKYSLPKSYTKKFELDDDRGYNTKNRDLDDRFKTLVLRADDNTREYSSETTFSSPLRELMDDVIRSDPLFKDMGVDIQKLYKKQADANRVLLNKFSNTFTENIRYIEEGTDVKFTWEILDFDQINAIKISTNIMEGGKMVNIDSASDGAQRLFLYALLKHKAKQNAKSNKTIKIIIIIDEPELHQHPSRHDGFYDVLRDVSDEFQVIYTTHSERYASIDDIEKIRFFGNINTRELTDPRQINYEEISKSIKNKIKQTHGKNSTYNAMSSDFIKKYIRSSSESGIISGLFAKKVVLVEGHEDKIILERVLKHYLSLNDRLKFKRDGVAIVVCNGKYNMPATYAFYNFLGINMYVIWDYDKNKHNDVKNKETNEAMCACLGIETTPNADHIGDKYTVFMENICKSVNLRDEPIYQICNKIDKLANNEAEFYNRFRIIIDILLKIYTILYKQELSNLDQS